MFLIYFFFINFKSCITFYENVFARTVCARVITRLGFLRISTQIDSVQHFHIRFFFHLYILAPRSCSGLQMFEIRAAVRPVPSNRRAKASNKTRHLIFHFPGRRLTVDLRFWLQSKGPRMTVLQKTITSLPHKTTITWQKHEPTMAWSLGLGAWASNASVIRDCGLNVFRGWIRYLSESGRLSSFMFQIYYADLLMRFRLWGLVYCNGNYMQIQNISVLRYCR